MVTSDYIATIISGSGAIISALAALAAIRSGHSARHEAREANESANRAQSEANRVANDAARLQALDWTSQYFVAVRIWGDEVTLTISEAMHLSCIRDNEHRELKWNEVRARLSALIDTGRWYFPNKYEGQVGTEKPAAYRGLRRRVLDSVVASYAATPKSPAFYDPDKATNDPATQAAYDTLEKCKRIFVSEIQEVLNPRHREEQVAEVERKFEISDQMKKPKDREPESNGDST